MAALGPGNLVRITGLEGYEFVHLNGALAEVVGRHPQLPGRYNVKLKNRVEAILEANLTRIIRRDERAASERVTKRQEEMAREDKRLHSPFDLAHLDGPARRAVEAAARWPPEEPPPPPLSPEAYRAAYAASSASPLSAAYVSPLADDATQQHRSSSSPGRQQQQQSEWADGDDDYPPVAAAAAPAAPPNTFAGVAESEQPLDAAGVSFEDRQRMSGGPFADDAMQLLRSMYGQGPGAGGEGGAAKKLQQQQQHHQENLPHLARRRQSKDAAIVRGVLAEGTPLARLGLEREWEEAELTARQEERAALTDSALQWKLFALDQKRRVVAQQDALEAQARRLEEQGTEFAQHMQRQAEDHIRVQEESHESHYRIRDTVIPNALAENYVRATPPALLQEVRAAHGAEAFDALSYPDRHRAVAAHKVATARAAKAATKERRRLLELVVLRVEAPRAGGSVPHTYQLIVNRQFWRELAQSLDSVSGSRDGVGVCIVTVEHIERRGGSGAGAAAAAAASAPPRQPLVKQDKQDVVMNEKYLAFLCTEWVRRVEAAGAECLFEAAVWNGVDWERCSMKDLWKWRKVVDPTFGSPPSSPAEGGDGDAAAAAAAAAAHAGAVAPAVDSFGYPPFLHVVTPHAPGLTGHYQLRTEAHAGYPAYLNPVNSYAIFTDPHGRWKIGAVEDMAEGLGLVKSKYPHAGLQPQHAPAWCRLGVSEGEEGRWIEDPTVAVQAAARLPPDTLYVDPYSGELKEAVASTGLGMVLRNSAGELLST